MHRYIVLDAAPDGRLLMLRDEVRRHHLVRVVGLAAPPVGSELEGLRPDRGFALLAASSSGYAFRVTFEVVDVSQQAALLMLHPSASVEPPQPLRPVDVATGGTDAPGLSRIHPVRKQRCRP